MTVIARRLHFCLFLSQAKYISQCIDEIKQELKQDNIAVKANAVCKLTYVSAACWLRRSGHRPQLTPVLSGDYTLHLPVLPSALAVRLLIHLPLHLPN